MTDEIKLDYSDPIAVNMLTRAVQNLTSVGVQGLRGGATGGVDDPRRSIEDECGYPSLDGPVSSSLYRSLFDRNPLANRVVQIMPKECWQKPPTLKEATPVGTVTEGTPFMLAWQSLPKKLGFQRSWYEGSDGSALWDYMQRADVRSRIGQFGIVVMLVNDGKNLQEPVDGMVTVNWEEKPVFQERVVRWERRNQVVGNRIVRNTVAVRERVMVGVERSNPTAELVWPDSPPTLNELKAALKPAPWREWVRYDRRAKEHVWNVKQPPPYTELEKAVIRRWAKDCATENAKAKAEGRKPFNPPAGPPSREQFAASAPGARPPQAKPGKLPQPGAAGDSFKPDGLPNGKPPSRSPSQLMDGAPGGAPDPRIADMAKGIPSKLNPLEPNNTFPEPYQSSLGKDASTWAPGSPLYTGGTAKPNFENPGVPQQGASQSSSGAAPNPSIPGAYGTDRQYGTSDAQMSSGYGMAAPTAFAPGAEQADSRPGGVGSTPDGGPKTPWGGGGSKLANEPGYGQLSGTDQQYFGVQIGPSEQPAAGPAVTPHDIFGQRIFDETLVQVVRYEWNINNPRFGLPVMYRVTLNDPRRQITGIGLPLATVFVHWSRVIHLAEVHANASTSEFLADPALQPVLENILDARKIAGAAAEGYWQSGLPTWVYKTHPQLGGDVLFDSYAAQASVENWLNSLQKFMFATGGEWDLKGPTVADPSPFMAMVIELVCICIACPVRVFKGSERGEQASSQDDSKWNDVLRNRQVVYLTPRLVCPWIDRFIALGVLPMPQGYKLEWPDLDSMSKVQKAQVLLTRTQAYAAANTGGVFQTIPVEQYMTEFDDMDPEDAKAMQAEAKQVAQEDQAAAEALAAQHGFDPAPPDGYTDPEQQDREHEQAMEVAKNPAPAGGAGFGGKPAPPGGGQPGGAKKATPGGGNAPPKPGTGGAPPAGGGGAAPAGKGPPAPSGPAQPSSPAKPAQPPKPPGLLNRLRRAVNAAWQGKDVDGRFQGEGGETFPSRHNPDIRYANADDRDADDEFHDRRIAEAHATLQAKVAAARDKGGRVKEKLATNKLYEALVELGVEVDPTDTREGMLTALRMHT